MMSVYIIAEIGINHNGSLELCHTLVDTAAMAGCDAVKLQLFRAETLYPISGGALDWHDVSSNYSYDIYPAVESFETPLEWLEPLQQHCAAAGIALLASVFDQHSLHAALRIGLPRLKLASSVITHLPLLEQCAGSGLPCILSTGGASLSEIERAVLCILQGNPSLLPCEALTLLHCCLQYPTPLADCNLGVLRTMALAFPQVSIGYSDHSQEAEDAPYAAVLLGANIIEKHITLDRNMAGPDHFFALEPRQLQNMVQAIRRAEADHATVNPPPVDPILYGSTAVGCTQNQRSLRDFVYPTLFTRRSIPTGTRIHANDLTILRPAQKTRGLEAEHLPLFHHYQVEARQSLPPETALGWNHIFAPSPHRKIILLRADAHKAVGTGDLTSFIALARWLEPRGWDCHFALRATSEGLGLVHSYGLAEDRIHALATNLPVEIETQLTAALALRLEATAVLVQVTDRPLSAYATMDFTDRHVLKCCVSFEETTPRGFDLVWSWDVTVSGSYDIAAHPQTRWFLGPEYVVLPPTFTSEHCQNRSSRSPRERLLVVMGGGDRQDLTSAVARKLTALGNPLHTTFVLGSGYAHEEHLRNALSHSSYPWDIKKRVTDMLAEYLDCDVCIAAGGLTASELAFTRTPALLIAACGHQDSRCALFAQHGWAKYLGTAQDWRFTLDDIFHFIPSKANPFEHRLQEVLETLDAMAQGEDL